MWRLFWLAGLLGSAVAYKAAVVEYATVSACGSGTCGRAQNALNVRNHEKLAAKAAAGGAQIVVFPEYSVTGFSKSSASAWIGGGYAEAIPELVGAFPCDARELFPEAPSVVSLSCIARRHGIALVANIMGHEGGRIYNTDVAFDVDGRLLARYRKQNLWGEPGVSVPARCEPATFTPAFGVTFGLITCADLIYEHPAVDLVRSEVRHFVMPSAWSNEMAQMQVLAYAQGWSAVHGVALLLSQHLAANESGSAIFEAGEALEYIYLPGQGASTVLIAEVPEELGGSLAVRHAEVPPREPSPERSTADRPSELPAQLAARSGHWHMEPLTAGRACSGAVCCRASVLAGDAAGYAIAALDGTDADGAVRWPAQVCAVLPCGNLDSCLSFQQPLGQLGAVELTMEGVTAASLVPEVVATAGPSQVQVLLQPGASKEGFLFSRNATGATLEARTAMTLTSAVLYGRPFAVDKLPYECSLSRAANAPVEELLLRW